MSFLRELQQLRADAGLAPAELAARAHYPRDVIVAAEAGPSLPDLPVLSAYLRGCGAGLADWEERWRNLTGSPAVAHCLPSRPAGCSDLASAGARLVAAIPEVDAADQRRIMAAISRAEAAIAATAIPAQPQDAASITGIGLTDAIASTSAVLTADTTAVTSAAGTTEVAQVVSSTDADATTVDADATVATLPVATASRPVAQSAQSASSRRTAFSHRAALAASVAAIICVMGAILLLLR